jgi:hypothetical protein
VDAEAWAARSKRWEARWTLRCKRSQTASLAAKVSCSKAWQWHRLAKETPAGGLGFKKHALILLQLSLEPGGKHKIGEGNDANKIYLNTSL